MRVPPPLGAAERARRGGTVYRQSLLVRGGHHSCGVLDLEPQRNPLEAEDVRGGIAGAAVSGRAEVDGQAELPLVLGPVPLLHLRGGGAEGDVVGVREVQRQRTVERAQRA